MSWDEKFTPSGAEGNPGLPDFEQKKTGETNCVGDNGKLIMKIEKSPIENVLLEKEQGLFPITDIEEVIYDEYTPDLKENTIMHYMQGVLGGEKLHRYKLLKIIENLHYVFSLGQSYGDYYNLSFKTEEYEYGKTNLGKGGADDLATTISRFLESVAVKDSGIERVMVSPADAAYSSQEIDECIDAIVASPENTLTREEVKEYKGFEIFDLYSRLFGTNFETKHHNKRSRAGGRSRFFKSMVHKYLSRWEIDDQYGGHDFYLKRKE